MLANKLTYYDNTKKRDHESQIVQAKEYPKLNHGGPSQKQASGPNQPINLLRQDNH